MIDVLHRQNLLLIAGPKEDCMQEQNVEAVQDAHQLKSIRQFV